MSAEKKSVFVIFDDSEKKSEVIKDVIGERGFCDVVVKRKRLELHYKESIENAVQKFSWLLVKSIFDLPPLLETLKNSSDEKTLFLHCFSNFVFVDVKKASLCIEKIFYIDCPYKIMCGAKPAMVTFDSSRAYLNFLNNSIRENSTLKAAKEIQDSFEIEGMTDIGIAENFIQCVSGNFDSRYFNSLKTENEYTITKTSSNKNKIRAEYSFYHLLPDDMKSHFVLPYNFTENENTASYTMERLCVTDLAIKYVHGSFDEGEFNTLMEKYFYFFSCRHKKKISLEEYKRESESLYTEKVLQRIEKLKGLPQFEKISEFIFCGTKEKSIDAVAEKYFLLKEKIEKRAKFCTESVIGHGDPCFANALYSKASGMLKFIDPKGALAEAELWTNPYYDIAKLSHSVCGLYDFFNNALFEIGVDANFLLEVKIDFDNSVYKKIFKAHCQKNGFDFLAVRLYEASLFLSMLPLHIDWPHKVLGFVLNAIKILEEIEEDIQ